jgi:hypothetical protein
LANQKIAVERYNLAQQPQAFAASGVVRAALKEYGNECLPLILVNDTIISRGRYPKREELARLTGVALEEAPEGSPSEQRKAVALPVVNNRCCS